MIQFWTRLKTGNGDKLVIEFLSTLEYELICDLLVRHSEELCMRLKSNVERKCEG